MCGLSFSAMLIVVSFVATPPSIVVSHQFHPGLLIPLWITARVALSKSIAGVVITRVVTSFLLFSSVPESVAIRVVCLG